MKVLSRRVPPRAQPAQTTPQSPHESPVRQPGETAGDTPPTGFTAKGYNSTPNSQDRRTSVHYGSAVTTSSGTPPLHQDRRNWASGRALRQGPLCLSSGVGCVKVAYKVALWLVCYPFMFVFCPSRTRTSSRAVPDVPGARRVAARSPDAFSVVATCCRSTVC